MSEQEQEFSFKNYFVPFTTGKAIWFIILIGVIVFANMLVNGFVWDDTGQIVENNAAHSLSTIPSYFFGTQDPSGNLIKIDAMFYRPLMADFLTIIISATILFIVFIRRSGCMWMPGLWHIRYHFSKIIIV